MIITVETDLKRPLYNKIDTIINILTVIITILDIIFLILDNSAYNDNLSIFCWCIFAPVPLFIMMLPENIYTWSNHTKLYLSVFVIGFVVYIFWFIWGGFLLNSNIYKKNYKYLYI